MDVRSALAPRLSFPAPGWAVTAWLLAPIRSIGADGDAELRQTLLRRLDSVLASAALSAFVATFAIIRHPTLPMLCWLVTDVAIASVRIPLVVHMLLFAKHPHGRPSLRPWILDLFICVGTLWSALLGIGTMLCFASNDPGLSVLAALVGMGTIGAQGVRSPGSPRLNTIQMCLIIGPATAGLLLSALPGLHWAVGLAPLYLFSMISITRQLHGDYVALMVARIENQRQALHCPLTDLPNRSFFHEDLAVALGRTKEGLSSVVMCLDLDGFKAVNDSFGHAAGDMLLREVADRLRAWAPSGTCVARLGGDEFAILLRSADAAEAEAGARSIIDNLGRPYELGMGAVTQVGVSIGLTVGDPTDDVGSLLLRADRALYAAKRGGRGTFRWDIEGVLPAGGSAGESLRVLGRRMRESRQDELGDFGSCRIAG